MNLYDFLFVLQMATVLGIFFTKLYNIFEQGKYYDIKIGFILFAVQWMAWLFGLMTIFTNLEKLIFVQIFKLEIWLILLTSLFFVIEFFFLIKDHTEEPVKAHMPERGGPFARV